MVMKAGKCASCLFWRRGASPNTEHAAPDDSDHELGACESMPPADWIMPNGTFVSRQPSTHATRSCAMWEPCDGDDGGGRRDGRDHTPSHRENIRNLFPVQPAPVAA